MCLFYFVFGQLVAGVHALLNAPKHPQQARGSLESEMVDLAENMKG